MTSIDIGLAVLESTRPDLVIARFKPGSVADARSFQVSMNARREHFSSTPHVVLVVAPEEVEFRAEVLDKDHYKGQGADTFTRGLGLVSSIESFARIIELYYALHPAPFPVKFFASEQVALQWAEQLLAPAPAAPPA